mgnify:FL=1
MLYLQAIFQLMKKLFLFISLLTFLSSKAQIHEVGLFLGGSNSIADVGPTNYINPNNSAFGLVYKWNKSPRHSWRFNYTQTTLKANDLDSDEASRLARGKNFKNELKELTVGLEFNFLDFNLHVLDRQITPYVFSGVSLLKYDEIYILGTDSKIDYGSTTFAIPMVVGVKTNITRNLILGAEVGARCSFTDNLDGSNPKNENFSTLRFGNINNNDWYMFSGITLTYTFGEKPCYCND